MKNHKKLRHIFTWVSIMMLASLSHNEVIAGNKNVTASAILPILQMLLLDDDDVTDICPSSVDFARDSRKNENLHHGDVDVYRLTPQFHTKVSFYTTGGTDTYGELFAENCTRLLAFNDDWTFLGIKIKSFNFSFTLDAGKTYYLRVKGHDQNVTGDYSLFFNTINRYTYLSAGYDAKAPSELGTGASDPYHPEYGETGYALNKGVHSNAKIYDSVGESYYFTVDPYGERTTVEKWKRKTGFIDAFGNKNANLIEAEYVNAYDLGFGRKMSCLDDHDRFPCIVENYLLGPNFDQGPKLLAYVAMERVNNQIYAGLTQSNDVRYYTAFYAFDKEGKRVNSVDLDGDGKKRIPEVCWSCHYGRRDDYGHNSYGGAGSRDGQYLPWDVNLFRDFPGSGKTIYNQKFAFGELNTIINHIYDKDTALPRPGPTPGRPVRHVHGEADLLVDEWRAGIIGSQERKLFNRTKVYRVHSDGGWYIYDHETDLSGPLGTPTTLGHTQSNTRDDAIRRFYNTYCRTCHIAQPFVYDGSDGSNNYVAGSEMDCTTCHGEPSPTPNKFPRCANGCHTGRTATLPNLKNVLCQGTDPASNHMPNAKITHKRFIEENFLYFGLLNTYLVKSGSKLDKLENAVSGNLCPSGYKTSLF